MNTRSKQVFIRQKAVQRQVQWSRHARENDRCYFFGGMLEKRLATIPFVVGSRVVVVREVPASVCIQCDEPVLGSAVASEVDRLLKQARHTGFEVSVVTYSDVELALA